MRVVARRAAEASLARLVTLTFFHLFDLSDEPGLLQLRAAIDREELDQRQARSKIEQVAADSSDPVIALKMALLADRRSKRRLQVPGIDDRHVPSVDQLWSVGVQFAGPMAPFATDRMATENRRTKLVERVVDSLDAVGMAKQTTFFDRPVEVEIALFVSWRQVPAILLADTR